LLTHSTFQKEFLFNYIKFISFQGGLTWSPCLSGGNYVF
jgi:hypothetical protein